MTGRLYSDHKDTWDALASEGRTGVAEMAKRFSIPSEMDRALGTSNAAASWASGRNKVSNIVETAARLWLKANTVDDDLKPPTAYGSPTPLGGRVLMVVCKDADADRAMKMLAILGCQVVEVLMNAQHRPAVQSYTPHQTRNELRRLASQLVQTDPLCKLLNLLADADLACFTRELWASDFDRAEMAIADLPDAFTAVVAGLQDSFDFSYGGVR